LLNLESERGPKARRTRGVTANDVFQPIELQELFCGTKHANLIRIVALLLWEISVRAI
jgi:hypothetical protein